MVFGGSCRAAAEQRVDLALVLAVDASSSVNSHEYTLQVAGYANAFRDADVIAAIEAKGADGIAVTYVEWSSRFRQVQSVGWTRINSGRTSRAFADAIAANARQLQASGTALGEAILYALDLFADNGFQGDRQVIDVSADDRYNAGSSPSHAQGIARKRQVTVNGLAIDASGKLATYFRRNVISGPGAFVMTAQSFDDFAVAIKRKLLREIGQQPVAGDSPQRTMGALTGASHSSQ